MRDTYRAEKARETGRQARSIPDPWPERFMVGYRGKTDTGTVFQEYQQLPRARHIELVSL